METTEKMKRNVSFVCTLVNRDMVDTMMFRNGKNFIGDTAAEGLDELARVTVLNDNEAQDEVESTVTTEIF